MTSTATASAATVAELAAQIHGLSAQLLAEVMKGEAPVDVALVFGHLAPAAAQQADAADLLADMGENADAHSAAYFLGVAAARFTAAQAAAAVGQETLARIVAEAQSRVEPAVSSDPALISRLQAEQRYVETVRAEQEAAGQLVPMSGMPGLSEWRAEVLRACSCPAAPTDCPVHAPLA